MAPLRLKEIREQTYNAMLREMADSVKEIDNLRAQLERMKCGHLKADRHLYPECGCTDPHTAICLRCEELAAARREKQESCAKEAESFLRGNLRYATEPLATISDTGEEWIKTIAEAIRAEKPDAE